MKMGVVYELVESSANDGIHIETAGPKHYIIQVKDRHGHACLIGLNRMQAKFMAAELLKHIEEMEKEDYQEWMARAEEEE